MPYIDNEGVYGEQTRPFQGANIHHEPLHIRCEKYDWYINEHLHTDLIQIFLIHSGKGHLLSEDKKLS
jgi:AraC family transcriptional activator of pobA